MSMPLSWATRPGELDSSWSTKTICPGQVAVLVVPLLSPLTLQGHFVILSYWQVAQNGFLQASRHFGSCPCAASCLMQLKGKLP